MPYLRSSFATQCTTATLSWCRTPTGVWSSGATAGPFCCFTRWEGGPRTTTCPSPGEWSSTPPCWKRASLIRRPPSYPSSLHPWCMRGQPRWSWWGMSYLWLNAWGYFINNTPPPKKRGIKLSFILTVQRTASTSLSANSWGEKMAGEEIYNVLNSMVLCFLPYVKTT